MFRGGRTPERGRGGGSPVRGTTSPSQRLGPLCWMCHLPGLASSRFWAHCCSRTIRYDFFCNLQTTIFLFFLEGKKVQLGGGLLGRGVTHHCVRLYRRLRRSVCQACSCVEAIVILKTRSYITVDSKICRSDLGRCVGKGGGTNDFTLH